MFSRYQPNILASIISVIDPGSFTRFHRAPVNESILKFVQKCHNRTPRFHSESLSKPPRFVSALMIYGHFLSAFTLHHCERWGLNAMVTGLRGEVSKCHQCSPHKCRVMPTVKLQALRMKSHIIRPRHRSLWDGFGSRVKAARGECSAPLNNWNPCAIQKTIGSPGWGLGVGPITILGKRSDHGNPNKTGPNLNVGRKEHWIGC